MTKFEAIQITALIVALFCAGILTLRSAYLMGEKKPYNDDGFFTLVGAILVGLLIFIAWSR